VQAIGTCIPTISCATCHHPAHPGRVCAWHKAGKDLYDSGDICQCGIAASTSDIAEEHVVEDELLAFPLEEAD
jgi:hypothetical protein